MKYFLFTILIISIFIIPVATQGKTEYRVIFDFDKDGLTDEEEVLIYRTDFSDPDTDGDGYQDGLEIKNGFSPLHKNGKKLDEVDSDGDGLSDYFEIKAGTDLKNFDSDGDTYSDKLELDFGYNPLLGFGAKLNQKIVINTEDQTMEYYTDWKKLGSFVISSGKPLTPTPLGEFVIDDKIEKAWSRSYGVWMPYWMSFDSGVYGIHSLVQFSDGAWEPNSHLGKPYSQGCVRVSYENAKFLYDWAKEGTKVVIE